MAYHYAIDRVDRAWAFESEEMGSKRKFWYRHPKTKAEWLFKYPNPGTGEHWAEKVAAVVARLIGVPCAEVRLAVCDGECGSSAKSFVKKRRGAFPRQPNSCWTVESL
jgi:hypothetical protein